MFVSSSFAIRNPVARNSGLVEQMSTNQSVQEYNLNPDLFEVRAHAFAIITMLTYKSRRPSQEQVLLKLTVLYSCQVSPYSPHAPSRWRHNVITMFSCQCQFILLWLLQHLHQMRLMLRKLKEVWELKWHISQIQMKPVLKLNGIIRPSNLLKITNIIRPNGPNVIFKERL